MKKKIVAIGLAVMTGMTSIAGCVPKAESNAQKETQVEASADNFNKTGLPILKEPQSVTITAITKKNKNFKELKFFQNMEDSTNVLVNWNMNAREGWEEKKSLLFAGNDLPDAFYGYNTLTDIEIVKYGSQGLLIPLNDLMEQYAPNFMHVLEVNPTYRAQITAPDGNIYALPTISQLSPTTHSKFFMNKTWLDQLGLPVPDTLEAFEQTLLAFKENDMNGNGNPNDEIPFLFRSEDLNQQNLAPLFGSFGQLDDYSHFVVDDNGQVVYTPVTEPFKDGIAYFHRLYSQGLLDQEGFTHDSNVYVAKIQDPAKIVGGFLGWSRNSTAGANKDDYVAIAPLKSADGKQIWKPVDSQITSKGSFAITKEAKNPEVLMRWIDESYESENSLQLDQGLFGVTLEKTAEGTYRYLPLPEGRMLDEQIHDYSPGNDGVMALLKETIEKLELNENLQERVDLDAFYAPYNVPMKNVFPNILFATEEVGRLAALKTDIEANVKKNYARWISEGGIEEEWDTYIKQLEQMNLKEFVQIYQTAYDRYMEAIKQ